MKIFIYYNYETRNNLTKQRINNNNADTRQHYIRPDRNGPLGANSEVQTRGEAFGGGPQVIWTQSVPLPMQRFLQGLQTVVSLDTEPDLQSGPRAVVCRNQIRGVRWQT